MRYTPNAHELASLVEGNWQGAPSDGWLTSRLESARAIVKAGRAAPGTLAYDTGAGKAMRRLERVSDLTGNVALLAGHDQEVPAIGLPILRVDNVSEALRVISATARERFESPVIAVTGSAGKTTTRSLLRHVLGSDYRIHEGGANYTSALRSKAFRLDDEDLGLFEVASIGLPTVEQFIRPTIAIITSIGEAHMDVLETLEGVAATKAILFEGLEKDGTAIINIDTPHADVLVAKAEAYATHIRLFSNEGVVR